VRKLVLLRVVLSFDPFTQHLHALLGITIAVQTHPTLYGAHKQVIKACRETRVNNLQHFEGWSENHVAGRVGINYEIQQLPAPIVAAGQVWTAADGSVQGEVLPDLLASM